MALRFILSKNRRNRSHPRDFSAVSSFVVWEPGGSGAAGTGGVGTTRPAGWGPPGYWWQEGGRSTPFEIFSLSGEENIEEGKH